MRVSSLADVDRLDNIKRADLIGQNLFVQSGRIWCSTADAADEMRITARQFQQQFGQRVTGMRHHGLLSTALRNLSNF